MEVRFWGITLTERSHQITYREHMVAEVTKNFPFVAGCTHDSTRAWWWGFPSPARDRGWAMEGAAWRWAGLPLLPLAPKNIRYSSPKQRKRSLLWLYYLITVDWYSLRLRLFIERVAGKAHTAASRWSMDMIFLSSFRKCSDHYGRRPIAGVFERQDSFQLTF